MDLDIPQPFCLRASSVDLTLLDHEVATLTEFSFSSCRKPACKHTVVVLIAVQEVCIKCFENTNDRGLFWEGGSVEEVG